MDEYEIVKKSPYGDLPYTEIAAAVKKGAGEWFEIRIASGADELVRVVREGKLKEFCPLGAFEVEVREGKVYLRYGGVFGAMVWTGWTSLAVAEAAGMSPEEWIRVRMVAAQVKFPLSVSALTWVISGGQGARKQRNAVREYLQGEQDLLVVVKGRKKGSLRVTGWK